MWLCPQGLWFQSGVDCTVFPGGGKLPAPQRQKSLFLPKSHILTYRDRERCFWSISLNTLSSISNDWWLAGGQDTDFVSKTWTPKSTHARNAIVVRMSKRHQLCTCVSVAVGDGGATHPGKCRRNLTKDRAPIAWGLTKAALQAPGLWKETELPGWHTPPPYPRWIHRLPGLGAHAAVIKPLGRHTASDFPCFINKQTQKTYKISNVHDEGNTDAKQGKLCFAFPSPTQENIISNCEYVNMPNESTVFLAR